MLNLLRRRRRSASRCWRKGQSLVLVLRQKSEARFSSGHLDRLDHGGLNRLDHGGLNWHCLNDRRLRNDRSGAALAAAVAKEAADEVEKLKEASVMRDVEIAGLFKARAESEGVLEKVMDDVKHLRERLHSNNHRDIESTLAATETSMRALEVGLEEGGPELAWTSPGSPAVRECVGSQRSDGQDAAVF